MIRKIFFCILAMVLIFPVLASAEDTYEEETFYSAPGFNPHRGYFNQAFNERVDPYSGNVLLTYTDIYVPGDGGLDLKLQRTYNSKIRTENTGDWDVFDDDLIECDYAGMGWSLHLGKVRPIAQFHATPAVQMPDGSVHPAFLAPGSTKRQTKELWKYEEIQESDALYAYLTLTNGTVYRFRLSGYWKDERGKDVTKLGASWYPVQEDRTTCPDSSTHGRCKRRARSFSGVRLAPNPANACSMRAPVVATRPWSSRRRLAPRAP